METWRFPGNHFTKDEGLSTADMETFKKDVMASLARELCQNSVDAKAHDSKGPVKIVFKTFDIQKSDIPQVELLEKQIDACKDTWTTSKKITNALNDMKVQLAQETITCLRISDFNTTGLIGVNIGGDDNPWHYLVHGSGLSEKSDTSGGSKGIGKFAAFVASHINTVFYSTKTDSGEEGYEGICKLCSAKQEGTLEKTLGIGYFGSDGENKPINNQLQLDKSFERVESGTDIFIVAFKQSKTWKQDIVSKILESFIVAIQFDSLVVEVDDVVISKETLKDIVYNDLLIKKELKKSIVSQYLLLNDNSRFVDTIEIEGYGEEKLYLLQMTGELEEYATNGVVMVRYPYMKILDISRISTIPCSAMCIIGNDNLNKVLRNVENPQHTNWEFKRIEDETQRNEIKGVYNQLKDEIRKLIGEHLSSSDNSKTDLEGAGDYLPGIESIDNKSNTPTTTTVKDKPTSRKATKNKNININASIESADGDGVSLDIGGDDGPDTKTVQPGGHNRSKGGDVRPGDKEGKTKEGTDGPVIMKQSELRSMLYRLICLDKSHGKYVIIFNSDYTEQDCTLSLNVLDEGGNRYPVIFTNAIVNGEQAEIENDSAVKLSLKRGEKIKVELITDQTELFSGEVKVYAYRK